MKGTSNNPIGAKLVVWQRITHNIENTLNPWRNDSSFSSLFGLIVNKAFAFLVNEKHRNIFIIKVPADSVVVDSSQSNIVPIIVIKMSAATIPLNIE